MVGGGCTGNALIVNCDSCGVARSGYAGHCDDLFIFFMVLWLPVLMTRSKRQQRTSVHVLIDERAGLFATPLNKSLQN